MSWCKHRQNKTHTNSWKLYRILSRTAWSELRASWRKYIHKLLKHVFRIWTLWRWGFHIYNVYLVCMLFRGVVWTIILYIYLENGIAAQTKRRKSEPPRAHSRDWSMGDKDDGRRWRRAEGICLCRQHVRVINSFRIKKVIPLNHLLFGMYIYVVHSAGIARARGQRLASARAVVVWFNEHPRVMLVST